MENIMKRQTSALAMHKQSHTISKSKPKIRIIHLFAPEIIKTDVANFRELVQRLTGKPDNHHHNHQKGCKKNARITHTDHQDKKRRYDIFEKPKEMEKIRSGFCKVGEEQEMVWNNGESSGGFLNSLGDLDGFIQELGGFPYFPLDPAHMHGGFAESHQLA